MENSSPRSALFSGIRGRGFAPFRNLPVVTSQGPLPRSNIVYKPLQSRSLPMDPQSACALYNGRIPPEIRDQIFIYALTEYTKPDPSSQFQKATNYTRPGYTGKKAITITLLQTCRRVYMETYHLPPVFREHVFWHERNPLELQGDRFANREAAYFRNMMPWQLELVKEVHLFTQMYWLEGNLVNICKKNLPVGVEKIKISIRRGDWWWNERNAPLGICPQGGSAQNGEMEHEWQREKKGEIIPWKASAWGSAFAEMKNLKELEIELETSEDKVGELKAIVEHAKGWKFPMRDGMVLRTDGLPTTTMEWRGNFCHWSDQCPYCGKYGECWKPTVQSQWCQEKERLLAEGKGPMLTVITVRYKLAKGEGLR